MAKRVLVTLPGFDTKSKEAYDFMVAQGFEVVVTAQEEPYTAKQLQAVIGAFDAAIVDCEVMDEAVFAAA
ncbi:MAG: hypothetical protein LBR77_01430, partial [Lachnospiraceae bacterium]|nr:hypothetical protein [Lachnospiraceae bacterium]